MAEKSIEAVINEALTGDTQKNALDFIAWLRANGMNPGGDHGEVSYKGQCVCYMHLGGAQAPGPWTIWTEGDYSGGREAVPMAEHMKEIARAHVNFCASCGDCSPGTRKTIFGKKFDKVCGADMAFYMPDAEALECVKKLLEIRKHDILKAS